MKSQSSTVFFLYSAATLLVSAGVLFFGSFCTEILEPFAGNEQRNFADESAAPSNILDTLTFLSTPCYEYCQLDLKKSPDCSVDVLSKTFVKVQNNDGVYEDVEQQHIKKLPLNSSLNFMIEKFTVKRKMVDNFPSFYITVESFNTKMERFDVSFIDLGPAEKNRSELSASQLELIRSNYAGELLRKVCNSKRQPV